MATVSLQHVTKSYGDVVAVSDVSLTVEHGEFVALLGPSGCGKTTTLQMLAGFVEATSGDILHRRQTDARHSSAQAQHRRRSSRATRCFRT